MKLYRFRPLNDFLFKELKYQELYYASAKELNDPLDLNARINFYSDDIKEIYALSIFILHQGFVCQSNIDDAKIIISLFKNKQLTDFLVGEFEKHEGKVIYQSKIANIITVFFKLKNISHSCIEKTTSRMNNIISGFVDNSAIACFTENNNNFLMWSHYASAHHGICLEFEVPTKDKTTGDFPLNLLPETHHENYPFDIDIHKVIYTDSLEAFDFFNFLPAFSESDNPDLKHLSKARYHLYGNEMKNVFTIKLSPWSSEQEWRIVDVNFTKKLPEDRISHFNVKAISAFYFGARISHENKSRIIKIFQNIEHHPKYFDSVINGTTGITFKDFEIDN